MNGDIIIIIIIIIVIIINLVLYTFLSFRTSKHFDLCHRKILQMHLSLIFIGSVIAFYFL